MKELKKAEELKKILEDDDKAIQILDKIHEENQKDFRRYIYTMMLVVICIVSIVISIISSIITNSVDNTIFFLPAILMIFLVIEQIFVLYGFNTKKIISDDQLKFLNAVLKEKTMTYVGKYPIIQKDDQCFIEENDILEHLGNTEKQTIKECQKFIYKQIEDSEGLHHPRYQIYKCFVKKY